MSRTFTRDFIHEVRAGNIPGHKIMSAIGERESIGTTSTGEDVCRLNQLSATPSSPVDDTFLTWPAAAGEQLTVISENSNDTSGGTGAQAIQIEYLDAAGDEQTTIVTMNGQTAVDLTPTNVRFVNDMFVIEAGSNNVAAGHIRIYEKADDTQVYNMIAAGGNKSLVPHRMVPRGKTLYLHTWIAAEGNNKRLTMRLRADCTPGESPVTKPGVFLFKSAIYVNQTAGAVELAEKIPALSMVKVSAWASAVNGEASVTWWGILVDD